MQFATLPETFCRKVLLQPSLKFAPSVHASTCMCMSSLAGLMVVSVCLCFPLVIALPVPLGLELQSIAHWVAPLEATLAAAARQRAGHCSLESRAPAVLRPWKSLTACHCKLIKFYWVLESVWTGPSAASACALCSSSSPASPPPAAAECMQ